MRCGCGRVTDRPSAQIVDRDGQVCFLLCERCIRDQSKRQHFAGTFARGQFGPDATLSWLRRDNGVEQREAAAVLDKESLARFVWHDTI